MWEEGHFRLFISHLTTAGGVAHNLKEALSAFNISCFVAHDDIEPTRHWQDEIEEALLSMDALAALLTPGFHESKWTDQEVGYAMGGGRLVLPIRHGVDPHGFIGKYQGYTIRAGANPGSIASDLVKILSRNPSSSRQMAAALVSRLESSYSFADAASTMSRLEECPVIPEELLIRIEASEESNGQVGHSFGVPARIQSLTARHREIGS